MSICGNAAYRSGLMIGNSTPRNLPTATATAAIVPVWITRNNVQPYRKPGNGPSDSRRKMYWPPARGNIAASSPYASAPSTVITAVSSQTTSSQNGEPMVRPMSADTMKMPEPIIDPATSMVASVNVRARTNSWRPLLCNVAASGKAATLSIPPLWRVRSTVAPDGVRPRQVVQVSHAPAGGHTAHTRAARAEETYVPPDALARVRPCRCCVAARRGSGKLDHVRDRVGDRYAVERGGLPTRSCHLLEFVFQSAIEAAVVGLCE